MVEAQKKCVESDKEINFLRSQVEALKHSQGELKGQLLATQFKISSMETLAKENDSLKNEVEELRESISKFHKGKENLDTLLVSQRSPLTRHGLGFNEASTSSGQKTTFIKSSSPPQISSVDVVKTKGRKPKSKQGAKTPRVTLAKKGNSSQGQAPKRHHTQKQKNLRQRTSSSNIQCHYCLKHGHINVFCHVRREQLFKGSFDNANHQGPKFVWVPKKK